MLAVSISRMTPKVTSHFHPTSDRKLLSFYRGSALCGGSCCSCTQRIYGFRFSSLILRGILANYHFSFFGIFLFLWIFILHLFLYFYAFSVSNCVFQYSSLMCPFFLSGNLSSSLVWWYNTISMYCNCISTQGFAQKNPTHLRPQWIKELYSSYNHCWWRGSGTNSSKVGPPSLI